MKSSDPVYGGEYEQKTLDWPHQAGVRGSFKPYMGGIGYFLSNALAKRITRGLNTGPAEFQTYASSSEDMCVGHWVGLEEEALGRKVNRVTFHFADFFPDSFHVKERKKHREKQRKGCDCAWANARSCKVPDGTMCNITCCEAIRQSEALAKTVPSKASG